MRRRLVALVMALSVVFGVAGCTSSDPDPQTGAAAESGIVARAAGRTWIDVRTPAEHAEGHLEGAVNVDVQSAAFRDEIGRLPRGGSYLVYCRSGNRSAAAAAIMAELGFDDVLDGGAFDDLVAAGLPPER